MWNLGTGQRIYHLRGFSAAGFTPDGALYADFPKYLSTDRTIARAALNGSEVRPEQMIDEKRHTVQAGDYLLTAIPAKENNTFTEVTLELRDLRTKKVVWTKYFAHERPGYHVDAPINSLVLYWQASSQSVHSIAKDDPQAAAALSRVKDRDGTLFVQVCDLDTGKVRAELALDTGKHSFQILEAIATHDRLIVADSQGRVLVYSLDGEAKGTINGHTPQVSAQEDLVSVRTEHGHLELYDLSNMQKRSGYDFGAGVSFDGFSGDGKRLLVLTSDQVVYVLDTSAKATPTRAPVLAAK